MFAWIATRTGVQLPSPPFYPKRFSKLEALAGIRDYIEQSLAERVGRVTPVRAAV